VIRRAGQTFEATKPERSTDMRLMMILYSMIGTAMAGTGVIAVLTMGYDTLLPILAAAAAGAVLALPVTWVVAHQID
jgi:predicted PurR-regulated permease PerM